MIHELKIWPVYFREVESLRKKFELRLNDRDFQIGDILFLKEFNPDGIGYTGRILKRYITYILDSHIDGIQPGYVILSLSII